MRAEQHHHLFKILCLLAVGIGLAALTPENSQSADVPTFNVRDYGAVGDGNVKDTGAVQAAIDACAEAGGGTVLVPAGRYLCGSVHLQSNVALRLENGATIAASPDDNDFDPYEQLNYETDSDRETTCFHFSLLWGEGIENVAIVGEGTIDGNRTKRGGPKPIALKRSCHIDIRNIKIINAPNYCISLLGCDYVNIDGVTILNGYCDGIDPDCCRHVRISNCHIESWDDAIVPKSSFALGERRASENIVITNCVLSSSCNAFKMGTESGGGFKYVTVSNCVMFGPPGTRPTISGIAIETVDGAIVENVVVSNISMLDVQTPIFVRLGNRGRDMDTPVPGSLSNVTISNVEATGATLASSITGLPGHPVENVRLDNVRIEYLGGGTVDLADKEVPELPGKYPEAKMFGELPAYGLYCRHARNVALQNLEVRWKETEERPALVCDDVDGLDLDGFKGEGSEKSPLIRLINVRNAFLTRARPLPGTGTFLHVGGSETESITVIASDLGHAEKAFEIQSDVPEGVFFNTANHLGNKQR